MKAMQYEYLIRRTNHSARNRSIGADADIYRAMEHAHRNLETQNLYKTHEEREYDYRSKFATVRKHVSDALKRGTEQIKNLLSEAEAQSIVEMQAKLTYDFYDKEALDIIIRTGDTIFHAHGLEMR